MECKRLQVSDTGDWTVLPTLATCFLAPGSDEGAQIRENGASPIVPAWSWGMSQVWEKTKPMFSDQIVGKCVLEKRSGLAKKTTQLLCWFLL